MLDCTAVPDTPTGRTLRFSKLKKVVLGTDCPVSHYDANTLVMTERALPFLYTPNIQAIVLKNDMMPPGRPLKWPANVPTAASLTSLRLEKSLIGEHALCDLLSTTPNLQTLHYEHWSDFGGVNGPQLRQGLPPSLQELVIAVRRDESGPGTMTLGLEECRDQLDSLQHLAQSRNFAAAVAGLEALER
ncbi:uncharacterized protein K452DRAFT_287513, partial [Aplosporella prunicola CBS 121167]